MRSGSSSTSLNVDNFVSQDCLPVSSTVVADDIRLASAWNLDVQITNASGQELKVLKSTFCGGYLGHSGFINFRRDAR